MLKKGMFLTKYLGFMLISLILLSACQGGDAAKDAVTVQFNREHWVEFIGFYVAEALGYYEDADLAVTLVAGNKDVDPVETLVSGVATFAVASSDQLVRARAAEQPVMGIATIYRYNPMTVMSLYDSFIRKPDDLERKVVGVSSTDFQASDDIQLLGMLNRSGANLERVEFAPIEEQAPFSALLSGEVQAVSGVWATREPVWADISGYDIRAQFMSDYGVIFYPNVIATTDQWVTENPDLVKRFVQATLKGYQYAIQYPEEVVAFVHQYDPSLDLELQRASMWAQIPYINTGEVSIGMMDTEVWQNTQFILIDQELLSTLVGLNSLYTNKFVVGTK